MTESDIEVWMRRLADTPADGDLPDPVLIWWRAKLLERTAAKRRAARPLVFTQWASVVVAGAAGTALSIVYWPGISALLAPFAPWTAAACAVILTVVALRMAFAAP